MRPRQNRARSVRSGPPCVGHLAFAACLAWVGLAPGPARAALPEPGREPAVEAAEPSASAPVSFRIEAIVVEGNRHAAAELIVAESLLRPGRSYTEVELRHAVYRIKRLPFLLEARFALRKGSERGAYELVITVEETSRVFFGAELTAFVDSSLVGSGVGTVGGRYFVGSDGVAFAAVAGDAVEAGYTHYNLFGRRVFASLSFNRQSSCCEGLTVEILPDSPSFGSFEHDSEAVTLGLGFPLHGNHSLRLEVQHGQADFQASFPALSPGALPTESDSSVSSDFASLAWVYDTTDDPVVPRRGRLVSAGVSVGASESRDRSRRGPPGGPFAVAVTTSDRREPVISASWTEHWPVGPRGSLSMALAAAARRTEFESAGANFTGQTFVEIADAETLLVEAGAASSRDLWSAERARRWGTFRFELSVRAVYSRSRFGGFEDDDYAGALSVGLVLRNRWGVFRLVVGHELLQEG